MRAVKLPQFLAIGINSEFESEFKNNKIYLMYKERHQCKPKTPIPILPVSFIRKC
jgi:hypothetical protein